MKKDELLTVLDHIGLQIKNLGNGDATNDKHGAVELLAMTIKDSTKELASALDAIAKAIDQLIEVVEDRVPSNMPDPK